MKETVIMIAIWEKKFRNIKETVKHKRKKKRKKILEIL